MNNKTAFVTGATSGFGKAIAQRLAQGGYNLIITGRREDRLLELQTELQQAYGIQVIPLTFDVRDKQAVTDAIASLKGKADAIDVLVNNAGLAAGLGPIQEGDTDDWDSMIDTNVKGLLYVTRQIVPFMTARSKGHIINIGSTAAKTVYKNGNVYCATKAAVDALNQAMRIDLLPYGIKVTGIHPGMAETEFSTVRFKGDTTKASAVYEDVNPLQPEDIADVVWYCVSLPPHVCINDLTMTCLTQANGNYSIKNADLIKSEQA